MALTNHIAKIASTLLAMMKCRAELASVEFEDEWKRLLGYFIFSLFASFCIFLGILMGMLLIIVLCWDTYRIPAIAGSCCFFLIIGIIAALIVQSRIRHKPELLELTRKEIARDIARLNTSSRPDTSDIKQS